MEEKMCYELSKIYSEYIRLGKFKNVYTIGRCGQSVYNFIQLVTGRHDIAILSTRAGIGQLPVLLVNEECVTRNIAIEIID